MLRATQAWFVIPVTIVPTALVSIPYGATIALAVLAHVPRLGVPRQFGQGVLVVGYLVDRYVSGNVVDGLEASEACGAGSTVGDLQGDRRPGCRARWARASS
ncbi:hypothetical protein [Haloechinothrix halophila]|uniref:hypothetical protein n=1 Tax=Haloechinothrix halophila TaxID=1069073 RepID=UPI000559357D|nr:hypothetical protein [Haloechinothrix halophila]